MQTCIYRLYLYARSTFTLSFLSSHFIFLLHLYVLHPSSYILLFKIQPLTVISLKSSYRTNLELETLMYQIPSDLRFTMQKFFSLHSYQSGQPDQSIFKTSSALLAFHQSFWSLTREVNFDNRLLVLTLPIPLTFYQSQ